MRFGNCICDNLVLVITICSDGVISSYKADVDDNKIAPCQTGVLGKAHATVDN